MPLPAFIAGAAGLGSAALRFGKFLRPAAGLIAKGGKWALNGARGILGMKPTVAGLAATATAATAIPALDNATGNKLSEFLFEKTPAAPILESLLKLKSWANEQPAKVVQNLIENELDKSGKIDQDSAEYQDSDYQTLVESMTHFATGDIPGAVLKLGKIKDVELKEADLIASYQRVDEEHPDASMAEKCALIVEDMHETIEKRREATQEVSLKEEHKTAVNKTPDVNAPDTPQKEAKKEIEKAQNTFDLTMLSGKSLSEAFDKATDKMGFTASILFQAASFLVGLFNDKAQSMIQKLAISSLDAEDKYDVLKDVCSRGNGVSANNNPFNIAGILDPDMDLALEQS